ncbi:MAG: NUDIX hydrolase, partial [Anaerolineae bacterium]|nr:NUDIX hydrolase [Anaerolineae bacterium]
MHWIQPRFSIGVVGILLDDAGERVLLLKHVFHHPYPWGLPGGWIERGEDPAVCIVRELREETTLRVRA